MTKKEYYTTNEAAKIMGVHKKQLLKWIKAGKIKASHLGKNYPYRIHYLDIPTYLRLKIQKGASNEKQ